MLGERSIKSDTGRRAGGVFTESTEQVREGRLSKMRLRRISNPIPSHPGVDKLLGFTTSVGCGFSRPLHRWVGAMSLGQVQTPHRLVRTRGKGSLLLCRQECKRCSYCGNSEQVPQKCKVTTRPGEICNGTPHFRRTPTGVSAGSQTEGCTPCSQRRWPLPERGRDPSVRGRTRVSRRGPSTRRKVTRPQRGREPWRLRHGRAWGTLAQGGKPATHRS